MTKTKTAKTNRPTIDEKIKAEIAKQIPKVETGMSIAMPNTVEEKMRAICNLSAAVSDLAKAVASVNVNITVEGCNFYNHKTALKIGE